MASKFDGWTYRVDSDKAFAEAIKSGRLQGDWEALLRYAANYMYMGTDARGRDQFKHIDTREYLA